MDTRKITLIATVAAIALIAIGVGYAYTAYTANNGNETQTAYVTLTQVGETTPYKFADDVKFDLDTYNDTDKDTIYYKLHGSTDLKSTDIGNYTCVLLGSITLHAELTNDDTFPELTVTVADSTGFDATTNWVYLLTGAPDSEGNVTVYAYKNTVMGTPGWTAVDGNDITMTATNSEYGDVSLYVYYGYASSNVIIKDNMKFLNVAEEPKTLHLASITFKAQSAAATHTLTYNANYPNADPETKVISGIESPVYILATSIESLGIQPPTGQVLKGWSLDPDGALLGPTIYLNTDKTVYAIWEDEPSP